MPSCTRPRARSIPVRRANASPAVSSPNRSSTPKPMPSDGVSVPFDRFPALWSGTDLEPYVPSPGYLGEHNFDVYRDLAGLSDDEIADGLADGLFS